MLKLFAISAMIPDDKLHDIMLYMENVGCLNIGARPVPLEASAMMFQQMGGVPPELMARTAHAPKPKAVAAPKTAPAKEPEEFSSDKARRAAGVFLRPPRNSTAFRAMQAATVKFLFPGREFFVSEFKDMLSLHAAQSSTNPTSRLKYYEEKGYLEKLEDGRFRVLKQWEPAA